jgi:hypothetical protein
MAKAAAAEDDTYQWPFKISQEESDYLTRDALTPNETAPLLANVAPPPASPESLSAQVPPPPPSPDALDSASPPPPPSSSDQLVGSSTTTQSQQPPPPPPDSTHLASSTPPPPPDSSGLANQEEQDRRSLLQRGAQIITTPMRGIRGLTVGGERLLAGDSLGQAADRAAAATQPGYQPQPGEKIGATAGDIIGSAPMYTAMAAMAPVGALGLGAVATAATEGGLLGAAGSAISQKSDTDRVSAAETGFAAAGGVLLGALAGKTSEIIQARAATKAADAALEKLNPLERATVLTNGARIQAAGDEARMLQEARDTIFSNAGGKNLTESDSYTVATIDERLAALQKWKTEMETFNRAKGVVSGVVSKEAADIASERIASLKPEDRVRTASELQAAASGPDPIVRPINKLSEPEQIDALLERNTRKPLDSEQALLGLKTPTKSMEEVANEALRMKAMGKPISISAGQQVREAVAKAIETGDLNPEQAMRLMGIPNLGTTQNRLDAARMIMDMSSEYGRGLSQLSRIAQTMERVLGKDPTVDNWFKLQRANGRVPWNEAPWTPWRQLGDWYRYGDGFRRGAMTSGLGTTVRNILSQGERSAAGALESAISSSLGAITGKISPTEILDASVADVAGLFRSLSSSGRAEIETTLSRFPLEAERLLGTPVGDVAVDQSIGSKLNTLNTKQEQFYRRAAFDSWTRVTAAQKGISVNDLPLADIRAGVDHALKMTYAMNPPKGSAGAWILDGYRKFPILTSLGNPFPRFWMNAMTRLYEFTPLPLFDQATYTAMAHPDPRVAFGAISKSMIGSGYVAAGYAMAAGGYWGEKWWEIAPKGNYKPGDKLYDMRPYNPVIAPLAVGRMIHDGMQEGSWALLKMTPQDWSQMLLSMKRTDATGVPLLDIVFSRSNKELVQNTLNLMSGYLASFVPRPIATIRDAVGIVRQEERLPRYTNEKPLTGQVISQVPFWSEMLPVRPSPLRKGAEERLDPVARVLGFGARIKTPEEAEADRLGITARQIYPHTGIPEYDRLIVERMGPILSTVLAKVRTSQPYMLADNQEKKAMFEFYINKVERASVLLAAKNRKDLYLKYLERNKSERVRDVLEDKSIDEAVKQGVEAKSWYQQL